MSFACAVKVTRNLMDVFMTRTRGGTVDVAKYGMLLYSGWGADPDDNTVQVFCDDKYIGCVNLLST